MDVYRYRFGDGTIRLTAEEAQWLVEQPGAPGVAWRVRLEAENWAGPGFTRRNDESTS